MSRDWLANHLLNLMPTTTSFNTKSRKIRQPLIHFITSQTMPKIYQVSLQESKMTILFSHNSQLWCKVCKWPLCLTTTQTAEREEPLGDQTTRQLVFRAMRQTRTVNIITISLILSKIRPINILRSCLPLVIRAFFKMWASLPPVPVEALIRLLITIIITQITTIAQATLGVSAVDGRSISPTFTFRSQLTALLQTKAMDRATSVNFDSYI